MTNDPLPSDKQASELCGVIERVEADLRTLARGPNVDLLEYAERLELLAAELRAHAGASCSKDVLPSALHLVAEEESAEQKPLVVAVDDDPECLDAMKEFLETHFDVLATVHATEAMQLIRERRPDAVVSDLNMPGMGGMPLLEQLCVREETAHIPFLVLSASGDTDAKLRAFEAGAFDFLTKPVPGEELVARVRNAVGRFRELSKQKRLRETDDLTGLPNRRAFRMFLATAMENLGDDKPLAVAMVDQDGLKQINDHYGHAAGDEAIRTVARALAGQKRASDLAARLGGDEFAVVMPGTDREGALRMMARVEEDLAQNAVHVASGLSLQISVSYGIACRGEAGREEPWEELLRRADLALYERKHRRYGVNVETVAAQKGSRRTA